MRRAILKGFGGGARDKKEKKGKHFSPVYFAFHMCFKRQRGQMEEGRKYLCSSLKGRSTPRRRLLRKNDLNLSLKAGQQMPDRQSDYR